MSDSTDPPQAWINAARAASEKAAEQLRHIPLSPELLLAGVCDEQGNQIAEALTTDELHKRLRNDAEE